jgi:hypothetical protein
LTDTTPPHAEYTRRQGERAALATELAARDRLLSNLRLAVFGFGAALAIAIFFGRWIGVGWLAPPVVVFVALLLVHERVARRRDRADRAVAFYERGLARLEHRFAGSGEPGERFRDPHHPYSEDLDLFGPGSLYERLCTARTRAGEDVLAGWLLGPAAPEEVRLRQEAVRELASALDLREDLALLGEDVRAGLHPEALRKWGEAPPRLRSKLIAPAAALLSAVAVGALGLWIFTGAGPVPFGLAVIAELVFASTLRKPVGQVVDAVEAPARDLDLLSELLERLEAERPTSPRLVALRASLDTEGAPASKRIGQLRRRVELLESRRNQLFAPIAALLLWKTQLALALERWRGHCGPALGRWVDAVAELEALAALAGFAYEQPDATWPELTEGEPALEATQIGHPLIPPEQRVCNDVALGAEPALFIVSGSNMSGKSTLMRSVGVGLVMAQAGAPVCAERLRLTPLQVGASIRIQDSLQEGTSRFYAEIQRLRQIMDLAGARPTLFLLDEILHGTNSHDRGIGAEAVVRSLLARGARGFVTTHDLALARVAEELAPTARNVHFEDRVVDGRIEFDYHLREGVVTRSNALELMRAVGLEV